MIAHTKYIKSQIGDKPRRNMTKGQKDFSYEAIKVRKKRLFTLKETVRYVS